MVKLLKLKQLCKLIYVLAALFFLLPTVSATADSPIIIDHNCTDILKIPETAIIQAKDRLHIAYGHTSHGSQLISGMGSSGSTTLDDFLSQSPVYGTTPGLFLWYDGVRANHLDIDDYAMDGDVGYYPQWVNNTRSYLGDPDPVTGRGTSQPDVNVVIWSWCGQASQRTEQEMIDTYLSPMNQLENDYPGIVFVYMTGHLDGSGLTGNLHLRNEQIRNYCKDNNKVLFDFADIESYDPDGRVNYNALYANDNCDYDSDGSGSKDRNWALDWQDSHISGVDWWESGAAHSQDLNGNRKGYAAWWLWAVLGGWNPDTDSETQSIQELVTDIYVATFGRAPAFSGLMYWANAVETTDFTIEQVAQSFFDQTETKAKFPDGSSNTVFIETIFYNVLNRAPQAAGLAYWVNALENGLISRDQAIIAIINGAKAETGSAEDAAMLAKKSEIGVLFANSEIGISYKDNANFMYWAEEIISFATSDDFDLEEAVAYIAELF